MEDKTPDKSETPQPKSKVAVALAEFHSKMRPVAKDTYNKFTSSNYASLSTILEHIKQPLKECELIFTQQVQGDFLETILIHVPTSDALKSRYPLNAIPEYHKDKDKSGIVTWRSEPYVSPQMFAAAVSFARRYSLITMLGLDTDTDEMQGQPKKEEPSPARASGAKTPAVATTKMQPNENVKKDAEAEKPWLNEKQFNDIKSRMEKGEIGLLEKASEKFRIKKAYRDALTELDKLNVSLGGAGETK